MNAPLRHFSLGLFMALATLPLGGCDSLLMHLAGESDNGGLAISNWKGVNATVSSAGFKTARTEPEWQALWQTVGQPVPGRLPDGKMAVAVFLGQRFDSRTRVEIRTAEIQRRVSEPEHAVVTYRESLVSLPSGAPGDPVMAVAGSIATPPEQALSPWAIRLMDKTVLEPDFQRED